MKVEYENGVFIIKIREGELPEITPSDIMQALKFELTKVAYKRFWEFLRGNNK